MTAIDIDALTDEQKAQIAAKFAAEEKEKKAKKAADKKLLKGLENDVVLKVIQNQTIRVITDLRNVQGRIASELRTKQNLQYA